MRRSVLFAFAFASSFQAANAQQLYTYNNGDNDSTPIVLTSGTDPTTLEIDSGSATQSGTISESGGSYGITKTGTGTLSFTAADTYTGATTINAGTLAIGSGGSIATSSGVNLANSGTTFDITSGGNQTIQALIGVSGSTVNLGANSLTIANSNPPKDTFGGSIVGVGGSLVIGNGTPSLLFLTGDNTYSGGTTINSQAVLTIIGSILGNVTVNTSGILDFEHSTTLTFTGNISGGGEVVQTGGDTLTLTGNNTFLGSLQIGENCALAVSSDDNLGDDTSHIGMGGTLETTASFTNLHVIDLIYTCAYQVDAGVTTVQSGVMEGDDANLTKLGAGTLILQAANTYDGGTTTIAAGILQADNAAAFGGSRINFTGGTLQYGAGITQDFSSRFSGGDGQLYSIDTNGENVTFATGIGYSSSLTKIGAGTLSLTAVNTYTGATTINGGTLAIGSGGSIATSSGVNLANSGATFDLSAAGNQTIGDLSGVAGSTVNLGTNGLTVGTSNSTTFAARLKE